MGSEASMEPKKKLDGQLQEQQQLQGPPRPSRSHSSPRLTTPNPESSPLSLPATESSNHVQRADRRDNIPTAEHFSSRDQHSDQHVFSPAKSTSLPAGAVNPIFTINTDRPVALSSSPLYSQNSDRQLGLESINNIPNSVDHVFPIRSIISVSQTWPMPRVLPRTSGEHKYSPCNECTADGRPRPSNPWIDPKTPASSRRIKTESPPASSSMESTSNKSFSSAKVERKSTSSSSMFTPALQGQGCSPSPLAFENASSGASDRIGDSHSSNATRIQPSIPFDTSDIASSSDFNENLIPARLTHVMTDEGHAAITGQDAKLQRCEDELIRTPGAIQGFGILVALREENDGHFSVRITSENSRRIISYSPQELFCLNSFLELFEEEQANSLSDQIDSIRDEETNTPTNGPNVFAISIRSPKGKSIKLWCATHIAASHPNLIICEFELQDDRDHPLRPSDEITPSIPNDTLHQDPTLEEFGKGNELLRKQLRDLRSAQKKPRELDAMRIIDLVSQIQQPLDSAPSLEVVMKILVGIVKELTGFHRVMIYQFDSAFNGKVVDELADPTYSQDLHKGLCFPASDIPKQARELYMINKVRLLYDRDLESAKLVFRSVEDMELPLDLTHSYLRALSPIHLKYVANMAVRASMSITVTAFNGLWGLISCHAYGPQGMRVAFPIRKMCKLVGDIASRNIERLSYVSRLQARKLINTLSTDETPSGYFISSSKDLLKLFDADYGMVHILSETSIMGQTGDSQEALAVLKYLRIKKFTSVVMTQDISNDFPDLWYPPGFSTVAGFLHVPLSSGGQDFIVFLRKGQFREVKWAGNPYDKVINEGTSNFLEPRSSFEVWHEMDRFKCKEWSNEQIETAAVLCIVYSKFFEFWRKKEAAVKLSRQSQLLLANSAHEVRTPLNAIINCLEIALGGSLDRETRDSLMKSHSASKSLITAINDLLDLTKTEEGHDLIKDEIFNLSACLKEATEPFTVVAKNKAIDYEVIELLGLPRFVRGDQRRVRQIIANLIDNAFQFTSKGCIKVECFVVGIVDSKVRIEIAVHDTGCGMSKNQLDALFRDFEQVYSHTDESRMDNELEESWHNHAMGLGLAVVARIMRNMDGQLRLKSEERKGSRFVLQLPFDLASNDVVNNASTKDTNFRAQPNSQPIAAAVTNTLPTKEFGEVILVDRGSHTMLPNACFHGRTLEDGHDQPRMLQLDKPTLHRARVTSTFTEASASTLSGDKLQILVAEDDPINMMIVRKQLEKAGHVVYPTSNGEDCARVYTEKPQSFDVVLMDLQMPILDGLKSTKMIRAFERSEKCSSQSSLAQHQQRVPIFAVSASLSESERVVYVDAGFDGWILKPINFTRLYTLLAGVLDDDIRNHCLYVQGEWECGGWFVCRSNVPSPGPEGLSPDNITSACSILKQSEART